jgi:hypothetical protein
VLLVTWTRPTERVTSGLVETSALMEEDNGPMVPATVPVPRLMTDAMKTVLSSHSQRRPQSASREVLVTKATWTRPTVRVTGGPVETSATTVEDNGPMAHATVPVPRLPIDAMRMVPLLQ